MPDFSELRILVIDDHQIVITGIRLLLKNSFPHAVVDGILSGEKLIQVMKLKPYHLIILDINMPGTDTHNLIHQIKNINKEIKILIFSMNPEGIFAVRYLKLGVNGYLRKEASEEELVKAITKILEGGRYLSPNLVELMSDDILAGKTGNVFDLLSPREFEIMKYLVKGLGIKEISSIINLHHSTVSTHKAKIYEKLSINNVVELREIADINNLTL